MQWSIGALGGDDSANTHDISVRVGECTGTTNTVVRALNTRLVVGSALLNDELNSWPTYRQDQCGFGVNPAMFVKDAVNWIAVAGSALGSNPILTVVTHGDKKSPDGVWWFFFNDPHDPERWKQLVKWLPCFVACDERWLQRPVGSLARCLVGISEVFSRS